jgi:hypothetical protein
MTSAMLPEFQAICKHEQGRVLVRIKFRDKVLSGIPKMGDPLDYYVKSKNMSDADKDDFLRRVKEGDVSDEEKEEIKETSSLQFEKDADGDLCIYHGNIKAMLREIFVCTGLTAIRPKGGAKKEKKGKKNESDSEIAGSNEPKTERASAGGRNNLGHMIHVDPIRVKFLKDGKPVQNPDGVLSKIKRISDANGRRSALGNHDYLEGVELEFILLWYEFGVHKMNEVKLALALAQDDGLGACRSQGYGKFDVVKWEPMK